MLIIRYRESVRTVTYTKRPRLPSRDKHLQGRFTGSVGSNDGNPTFHRHIDVDIFEDEFFLGVSKGDLIKLEKRRRYLLGIRESVRSQALGQRRRVSEETVETYLKVSLSSSSGGSNTGNFSRTLIFDCAWGAVAKCRIETVNFGTVVTTLPSETDLDLRCTSIGQ